MPRPKKQPETVQEPKKQPETVPGADPMEIPDDAKISVGKSTQVVLNVNGVSSLKTYRK